MAVLQLRIYPDPVLRTRASEVTEFGPEIKQLVDNMLETMDEHHGAGLAANQVGVLKRVFVYDCGGQRGHIINPTWTARDNEEHTATEGCLSIPAIRADCTRFMNVVGRGYDYEGNEVSLEATEILARCLQHETDHLDGILFLQRLTADARKQAMREIRASAWFNQRTV